MQNHWKSVSLHGSFNITRAASCYELTTPDRLPGVAIRIKIFQADEASFTARSNARPLEADGYPGGHSGFGSTEEEALTDWLHYLDIDLGVGPEPGPRAVEWSDPVEFLSRNAHEDALLREGDAMSWKDIELHGGDSIARVCAVYEIDDVRRFPWGRYKIKVLERKDDFVAVPNACIRDDEGKPLWTMGVGSTEVEALQEAIRLSMAHFITRPMWEEGELEWADPRHF